MNNNEETIIPNQPKHPGIKPERAKPSTPRKIPEPSKEKEEIIEISPEKPKEIPEIK